MLSWFISSKSEDDDEYDIVREISSVEETYKLQELIIKIEKKLCDLEIKYKDIKDKYNQLAFDYNDKYQNMEVEIESISHQQMDILNNIDDLDEKTDLIEQRIDDVDVRMYDVEETSDKSIYDKCFTDGYTGNIDKFINSLSTECIQDLPQLEKNSTMPIVVAEAMPVDIGNFIQDLPQLEKNSTMPIAVAEAMPIENTKYNLRRRKATKKWHDCK